MTALGLTRDFWLVLGLYWLYAARGLRPAVARENVISRVIHLSLLSASLALLLGQFPAGPLDARLWDQSWAAEALGAALTGAGVAFAIWARAHLGSYWSGTVTLKEGHRLIRTGPYRLARHPIYTGIVIATLGSAIARGEWRGGVAIVLMLAGFLRKIQVEENMLKKEFAVEYEEYRRAVKMLIPGLF